MTSVSKYDPSKDIPDLSGKVILITGGKSKLNRSERMILKRHGMSGNTGLGKESILHLAQHNPKHIYFTSRLYGKSSRGHR